jgi:zinc protease
MRREHAGSTGDSKLEEMLMHEPQTMRRAGARRHAGIAVLAGAVLAGACATTGPGAVPAGGPATASVATPQAPDRTVRPAVGEAPDVALPPLQEFTLPNGLRVVVMEKRDLPLVQLNLLIHSGSAADDAGRPGLASITAAMLEEGAAGMSALELADAFEYLGARFGVNARHHVTGMVLRAETRRFPEALALAGSVLLQPDFPEEELDRLRMERLTALVRQHDEPAAVAGVLFDRTLFGVEHAYGRSGFGTEASLRAVTTADLRSFYRLHYRPNNATAVLVGDIDVATAERLLGEALGGWQRREVPAIRVADREQVRGRTIHVVDIPGSAQSVIRLGRIGAPRTTADYYALNVMNVILGGSFTSRLMQNLREDKGYTYGASSFFDFLPAPGPWLAGAAVQTNATGPALAEFMNELRGMHQPIPADEVARARNFLAMQAPAAFQSVAATAAQIGEVVQYGLPADYFNHYVDNILAVTAADVERVARQYIDPDNVAIVVVGDRAAIEQQIRDQDLGPIHFLEVRDVLGPVPELGAR